MGKKRRRRGKWKEGRREGGDWGGGGEEDLEIDKLEYFELRLRIR